MSRVLRDFGDLDAVVRRAVQAERAPRRSAPVGALLRASYISSTGRWVSALGLVFALAGPYFLVAPMAHPGRFVDEILRVVLALFAFLLGTFLLIAPAINARRAAVAVRRGIHVLGEVTEVSFEHPSQATIDAMANGFATGRWRVSHPAGPFEERFEMDTPWARLLRPGSSVLLLADPVKPRVLLALGPRPPE